MIKYFMDGGSWTLGWKYDPDRELLIIGGPSKFRDVIVTMMDEIFEVEVYSIKTVRAGAIKVSLPIGETDALKKRKQLEENGIIFSHTKSLGRMIR